MSQVEKGRLITEADYVLDLMKHPGMAVIREKIKDARTALLARWWQGETTEEREAARQEAKSYEAFFNLVKVIIIKGKQAKMLSASEVPSGKPEQGA